MGVLLFIGTLLVVGYWAYTCGKRIGSKLAYRVGRRHGREIQRQHYLRRR